MTAKGKNHYIVRPLEKSDIPVISRWFCDLDDLSAFDRSIRVPLSVEATEKAWSEGLHNDGKNGKYWFAIEDPDEKPVGIVGLQEHNPINRDAVLALYITKALRRSGLGIRATALIVDLAFDQLGLNRITSYYHDENEGSRKVTKSLGFEVEGCMRKAWFRGGRHMDLIVVGLLRQDWADSRKVLAGRLGNDISVSFGSRESPSWRWPPE